MRKLTSKKTSARLILFIILSLLPFVSIAAPVIRISISDFQVQSDNPQYKYLGKGFAEFIGIDIVKSPNIELIDRERRVDALREQELGQSGLVDEKSQIKIGKMLSVRYIVFGSIFDMAGQLTVTFKVIDTETGKVIIQDKVSGKLTNYEFISAAISQKLLSAMSVSVSETVVARAQKPVEKQAETAVKFSNAMDAYDKKDMSLAKRELDMAKELDPENDAVQAYLKKLVVNTAKFKTLTEQYYPNQNPAYLGIIKTDRLFLSSAQVNMKETQTIFKSYNVKAVEQDIRLNLGYQFPIGSSMGASVEAFLSQYKDQVSPATNKGDEGSLLTNPVNFGGIFSLGNSLNDYISLGGGASIFEQRRGYTEPGYMGPTTPVNNMYGSKKKYEYITCVSGFFGFLIKNQEGTFIFDTMGGYSSQKTYLLDPVNMTIGKLVKAPVYNENTMTIGLFDKRIFLAVKEVNNKYTDRNLFVARVIPAMELWVSSWMSLRGGFEWSYVKQDGEKEMGKGWTSGLSLRSLSKGYDFDINYTKRTRPSRAVEGESINESIIYFSLSKSNLYLSR